MPVTPPFIIATRGLPDAYYVEARIYSASLARRLFTTIATPSSPDDYRHLTLFSIKFRPLHDSDDFAHLHLYFSAGFSLDLFDVYIKANYCILDIYNISPLISY